MTYEEADKAIQDILERLKGNVNIRLFTLLADISNDRLLFQGLGCQACAIEVIIAAYNRKVFKHEDEVDKDDFSKVTH